MEHSLTIQDLNFDPPQLSASQVKAIAKMHFGVSGALQILEGERDQNARFTTAQGRQYVLKIAGAAEQPAVVDFQVEALLHIERTDPALPVPRVVRGKDGGVVYTSASEKGQHQLRLLTYLPGILYQQGPEPSLHGLYQVGEFLGRLNRALQHFSHPAAGYGMVWDSTSGLMFRQQFRDLLSAEVRRLISPAMQRLEHEVHPQLHRLPRQVIHHDGHGANLLRASVDSEQVTGIIDFGDMIVGPPICDLAVSLTHFIETARNPVAVAAAMCRGFYSVFPLQTVAVDLLLDLVIARQILILQLFEFRRRYSNNPPAFVISDQAGIIASLNMLTALDRGAFQQALREAVS